MGICQSLQMGGEKLMGRKYVLSNNPDKGRTGKQKIKYEDHPIDISIDVMCRIHVRDRPLIGL